MNLNLLKYLLLLKKHVSNFTDWEVTVIADGYRIGEIQFLYFWPDPLSCGSNADGEGNSPRQRNVVQGKTGHIHVLEKLQFSS